MSDSIPQYMWNAVYVNTGTDRFAEAAHLTGMQATGWTRSARLGDLDNDGRIDAFVTAGMIRNFIDADVVDRQNVAPSLAARAAVCGVTPRPAPKAPWPIAIWATCVSPTYPKTGVWMSRRSVLAAPSRTWTAMVTSTSSMPTSTPHLRWCATIPRPAIAVSFGWWVAPPIVTASSEARIQTASGQQVRQLFTERGIASSEPALLHFGLENDDRIRSMTVRWPSGVVQELQDPPADHLLTLHEPPVAPGGAPAPARFRTPPAKDAWLVESAVEQGLNHRVVQTPYDEFLSQRLLPRRLNGLGPALAVADVNGDNLADLFVSGTAGQAGRLFLAQSDDQFVAAPSQPWTTAAEADDVRALFFDLNGDKAPDLYLAAGGVQYPRGDRRLNDRIDPNDGKGGFLEAAPGTLPADGRSTAAVAAADFNQDHRVDLFVGGRVVPGSYPKTPRSFLYRSDNGRLVDVTERVAPGLRESVWSPLRPGST